ncbi:MAG: hydantoinase B/oxoprolinase family protein [Halofilum sp. (in: g-proteobacteria)]|nr:hydantoinase B/oxoprolinase family protein [Halofilum sp. (in: g-proteobacteria)]
MLNDPYNGGTHLPDITVVKPVFDSAGDRILFYTASRGHHADVGGITPGSMAPDSTNLEQEGVLLDNVKMVDATAASSRTRSASSSPRRATRRATSTTTSPT